VKVMGEVERSGEEERDDGRGEKADLGVSVQGTEKNCVIESVLS